jgi:uncharacterized protein YdaU (DUF1376 family)
LSKKLPFYQMHPADFDTDENVRGMGLLDVGLFLICLNHSWMNDGLPSDPERIQKVLRVKPTEFGKCWKSVEPLFPLQDDGRRRNPRQERERTAAKSSSKTQSERGKKGAEARWNRDASSMPEALPKHEQAIARASESLSVSDSGFVFGESAERGLEISVGPILDELESVYKQAGAPIPEKHRQLAAQLLISVPPEKRHRVPNYCKWALVTGKWPSAAKTKALLNVLRDGDWDVEITPRVLPIAREPSRSQQSHDEAADIFRRENARRANNSSG